MATAKRATSYFVLPTSLQRHLGVVYAFAPFAHPFTSLGPLHLVASVPAVPRREPPLPRELQLNFFFELS